MLKLHGFSVSNYYNMVKLALLEKGLPFEEVTFYGGQAPQALEVSPRGKVPVLETEHGFLSETSVILDYIEQTQGGKALLPADPFGQAKVRELLKEIELYIELPARLGYSQAFFGVSVPEALLARCKSELLAGVATLKRHGRFSPYVAGEALSVADLYFLYSLDLACVVAHKLFGLDLLADFPAARTLLERLNQNPHVQRIAEQKVAEMPAFLAFVKAQARG